MEPAKSGGRKQQSRWKTLAVYLGSSTDSRTCIGRNEAASTGRSQACDLESRVRTIT